MSLKNKITDEIKSSMKERNTPKLNILRVLKAEIERAEQTSNGKTELSDSAIVLIVKKLVQSIKDTTNDADEISVLEVYLPKQLTPDEMREIILALPTKNLGETMKHFKLNYDGMYDGKKLSEIIKEGNEN